MESAFSLFSQGHGPSGERTLVCYLADFTASLVWADGRPATDLTSWLPDLVLIGWQASCEPSLGAAENEKVSIASLCLENLEVYLLDDQKQQWLLDQDTVNTFASLGLDKMIVAGVAHEAASVPEDLSKLL